MQWKFTSRKGVLTEFPDDEILIELMSRYHSYSGVARHLGVPHVATLTRHVKRHFELHGAMEQLRPIPFKYPADEVLLSLMEQLGSYAAVARRIGIDCSALCQHLRRKRPDIKLQMDRWNRNHLIEQRREERREKAMAAQLPELASPAEFKTTRLNDPQYRERMKQYLREYNMKPENKQRQRENYRRWAQGNPEKVRAGRERNKKRRAEQLRRWKDMNPELVAEYEHKRRMRRRGNGSRETYTRKEIFERDGWVCQICGSPVAENPTIDHIIPLIRGGNDAPSNVQLAHFSCNASKGAR